MFYTPMRESYYEDKTQEFRRQLARTYGFMALGLAVTFGAAHGSVLSAPRAEFLFVCVSDDCGSRDRHCVFRPPAAREVREGHRDVFLLLHPQRGFYLVYFSAI